MAIREDLILSKEDFIKRRSGVAQQQPQETSQPKTQIGRLTENKKYQGFGGGLERAADKFLGGVANIVPGLGKLAANKILGGSNLFEKYIGQPLLGKKGEETSADFIKKRLPEGSLEYRGVGQNIGRAIGEVGTFLAPSAGVARLAGKAGEAVSAATGATGFLSKAATGLAKYGTLGLGEAGLGAISQSFEEGEINKQVGTTALWSGAIPVALPLIGKAFGGATKTLKFGLGKAAKLGNETIETIVKNPGRFAPEAMENMTKANLTQKIANWAKGLVDDKRSTGAAYDIFREAGEGSVKLADNHFDDIVKKWGIIKEVGEDGVIKLSKGKGTRAISKAEISKLQEFFTDFDAQTLNADEFLNARDTLSGLSHFDSGKSKLGDKMFREMRAKLNIVKDNFSSGGHKMSYYDDIFSKQAEDLKPFINKLFDKQGNLKDSAYSVVGNLDKEAKKSVFEGIQKLMPDINLKQELKILRAIQDIGRASDNKVGTYGASMFQAGGVMASVATGNPMFAASLLARPSIIVPVLRMYGKVAGVSNKIITKISNKLFKGTPLTKAENEVLEGALKMGNKLPKGQTDELLKLGAGAKPLSTGAVIDDISQSTKKKLISKKPSFGAVEPTNKKSLFLSKKPSKKPSFGTINKTNKKPLFLKNVVKKKTAKERLLKQIK